MYPPPHHQTQDILKMIEVIRSYPLGMLVTVKNNQSYITHIPFVYSDPAGTLLAHIDVSNPQAETLKDGAEVKVVFRGPDAYISPSIYTTKQLPTWNYIIVHITGTVKLINDAEIAKEAMIEMTEFLEKKNSGFTLKKDDARMNQLINYIQTFEVTISNWDGKFKLSQDKIPIDYENAKEELIRRSQQEATSFITKMYR